METAQDNLNKIIVGNKIVKINSYKQLWSKYNYERHLNKAPNLVINILTMKERLIIQRINKYLELGENTFFNNLNSPLFKLILNNPTFNMNFNFSN